MKKLWNTSMIYLILALAGGVFYREFSKFHGYTGRTTLAYVHTHLLVLGMFLFLLTILFVILSILVYTFFSRMFDLMLPPVAKHSIVVA